MTGGGSREESQPPLPPLTWVPEEERRWRLCVAIAETNILEGGGLTLAQARWYEARDLFRSDLPTGDPLDPPAQLR